VGELPRGVTLRPGARADGAAVIGLWQENPEIDEAVVAADVVLDHLGGAAVRLRGRGAQLLRLVVARDAEPIAAVLATLRVVGERLGPVAFTLPGPHAALPTLLDAGVRISDRDTFMASGANLVDPERLLPHPAYLLVDKRGPARDPSPSQPPEG